VRRGECGGAAHMHIRRFGPQMTPMSHGLVESEPYTAAYLSPPVVIESLALLRHVSTGASWSEV
jgi:hypothetical protein